MTVDECFLRQDGLIAHAQAVEAGLSPAAIRRRVASGAWRRVQPRVYRSVAHPATARARVRAAALSVGGPAVLVGVGAAFWWRLTAEAPAVVTLAVDQPRRLADRAGVRLRRRPVPREERHVVDGVLVSSRAVAVLDAGVELGLGAGAELVDRALLTGSTSVDALRDAHLRAGDRWGAPVAARLVELAAGGARSEAERVVHRALRRAGLVGWTANLPVRLPTTTAVLDVAFLRARVVLEVDGWAYHRELAAFLRDAARQNALVEAGWTVLRTNWHELRADAPAVVARVRRAVERATPAAA